MSETDCTAAMTKMGTNADGSMNMDEAKPLFDKTAMLKIKTKTPDMMSKEEFMGECMKADFEGMMAK